MTQKIYTKKGDDGSTSLIGGRRILKCNERVELYGSIDELNSFIGDAIAALIQRKTSHEIITLLDKVQNELFVLGSFFACEDFNKLKDQYHLREIDPSLEKSLEHSIDQMNDAMPVLKNFIRPVGTAAACKIHICRSVCRRVEREMVRFEQTRPNPIPDSIKCFLNRLSDYFFVLARKINHDEGVGDITISLS